MKTPPINVLGCITVDLTKKYFVSTKNDFHTPGEISLHKRVINYVPYQGALVGLYRFESFRGRGARGGGTHMIELEKSNEGFHKKIKTEKISDLYCEDPRVFLYKERPFGIFWTGTSEDFYLCDIINKKITKLNTPKTTQEICERYAETGKNWSAMVIDNELYIVFKPDPLVIFKYHEGGDFEFIRETTYEGDPWITKTCRRLFAAVRNGTSYIKVNKNWYSMAHRTTGHRQGQGCTGLIVKISEDFKKVEQIPVIPLQEEYRKGFFEPLSVYKEEDNLVFVINWQLENHLKDPFSTPYKSATLECKIPFDVLDLAKEDHSARPRCCPPRELTDAYRMHQDWCPCPAAVASRGGA